METRGRIDKIQNPKLAKSSIIIMKFLEQFVEVLGTVYKWRPEEESTKSKP